MWRPLPSPLATCLAGLGLLLAAAPASPPAAARARQQPAPKRRARQPTGRPTKRDDPRLAGQVPSFRYVPTAAARRQAVQTVAARLQANQPAEAQAVRDAFGPGQADYAPLYAAMLRGSGLADNDAASALALHLEAGYRIVHDITNDDVVTATQEQGLRAQAARLLAADARLRTSAAVARRGEELKLQSVLLVLGWQAARKAGTAARFRLATAQQFSAAYGLDLRQLTITAQGFVAEP